jgi:ribosomal protein S18 acetylase RimI-like enzyme
MESFFIRKYNSKDRIFIRNIAYNTAFRGESADIFFDDKEVLADFLTKYFTDFEPESIFVADNNEAVVGYIIGARNIKVLNTTFILKVLPKLLIDVIARGVFFKRKCRTYIINSFKSFLKGEFKMPDFSNKYPAVLHINIDNNYRSSGLGRRLMFKFLSYLTDEKVPGVQLSTISEQGKEFFEKQGFSLLYKGERSYFKNILGGNIVCYSLGKVLPEIQLLKGL